MNKYLLLIFATSTLSLTGCAQMIPAQATKLENGNYMIQTASNILGSNEAMENKVNKKAETVCDDKGFSEINNNHQTHSQQIYTAQVITTGTYKTFNKTIKCN
ncbi:hypothetical protein [Acinetobacter calcoaceticus]|uniref:hypothetical protein n=1 Tax=Acinetobacter calcoaceticus TaxID=471 RepID=UPI003AF6EA39